MNDRVGRTVGRVRSMAAGFTPGQRGVVVVAVLALVLGAFAFSRWVSQPSWTPLFSNLSGTDASAVVEQLRTDGVEYQLTNGGSTVLVPQAQVATELTTTVRNKAPEAFNEIMRMPL